jgi:hypothetical protein
MHPPDAAADTNHLDDAPRRRSLLAAAGIYLFLSLIVWWNIWTRHPTSTTTCGCGDSSLFTWFLEWPAYAISQGQSLLHSTAIFHPGGVNLLSNTSELAFGVVLAPITWIFGPVASFNTALTLSPALSALAMFVLVRRWVSWMPAAFIAGLLYGFSPFILANIADGHLMVGMAAVPPLALICLDDLLIRQRRRPITTGVLLGLLVTLQFFIGTEVLAIMVIMGIVGVALVVVYGLTKPDIVRARARYAIVGASSGVITALVLLGYPAWFALAGPAHLSQPVWAGLGYAGTVLKNFVVPPKALSPDFTSLARRVGGPQGRSYSMQYFGAGVAAVMLGGLAVWFRDRRLWLFAAITTIAVWLSLGVRLHTWRPWQMAAHLPLLENIVPSRFVLIAYLSSAVMLGLIVDHAHEAGDRWSEVGEGEGSREPSEGQVPGRRRSQGVVAGLLVGAIALAPIGAYLGKSTPIVTQTVALPEWFRTVAPHLPSHQVLLVFPVPPVHSSLTWQAVNRMHYSMAQGGGPGAVPERAGKQSRGQSVIVSASVSYATQAIKPGDISAVRQALDAWEVTMVVIPDEPGLPAYDRVTSVPFAVAVITAATGRAPILQASAWVWSEVDHAGPSLSPDVSAFSRCTSVAPTVNATTVAAVASCVLKAAPAAS